MRNPWQSYAKEVDPRQRRPAREGASGDAWWRMDWRWIDGVADAAGTLGACALVMPDGGQAKRLVRHAELVSALLGCDPSAIELSHDPAGRPVLLRPRQALHLSRATRDGIAVLAAAPCPVGVDIERIEPDREPAWNVLSGTERTALTALPEEERAEAFAQIWSAKEAYLKALGVGLRREPGTFSVLRQGSRFTIQDRERPGQTCLGVLTSHSSRDRRYILAGITFPAS